MNVNVNVSANVNVSVNDECPPPPSPTPTSYHAVRCLMDNIIMRQRVPSSLGQWPGGVLRSLAPSFNSPNFLAAIYPPTPCGSERVDAA